MLALILRRLVSLVVLILAAQFLTIVMLEQRQGGFCDYVMPDHASADARLQCEKQTEQSLFGRFWQSLKQLSNLHLGNSISSGRSVLVEIGEQAPFTVQLALASLAVSLVLGVLGGVVAARYGHGWGGTFINWVGISLLSLPTFVVAFLLLNGLALRLGWVSVLGNPSEWRQMLMPLFAVTLPLSAWFMRITRNAVAETLAQDYIRTAHAKGLRNSKVLLRHALRNALGAVIPLAGLSLAALLDGALIVEIIFSRPGLGRYTLDAVVGYDYPAIQGVVLFVVASTLLANLLADLVQYQFFPQSRYDLT